MTEWRRAIDPPERGELVLVGYDWMPGWQAMHHEKASLVTSGHNIWVSEDTGHIVYPTHWKALE